MNHDPLLILLLNYAAMGLPFVGEHLRARLPGLTWRNAWHPGGLNLLLNYLMLWPALAAAQILVGGAQAADSTDARLPSAGQTNTP